MIKTHTATAKWLPCLFTRCFLALASLFILISCADSDPEHAANAVSLVDAKATPQTRALYQNLHRLSPEHVLFGHQDALAYGVLWEGDEDRSDARDVTGSHPALYGWEIGNLELGAPENLDKVNFERMRRWIQAAYQRGGVTTISWHMNSPATGGNAWDTRPTVAEIIPGGSKHEQLKAYLDAFVVFNEQLALTDEQGEKHYIPLIFRPWHEHNGDWFWWGKGHASEADYIALWRFTVEYLRDDNKVHNLIYAFSPDRSRTDINHFKRDYLYGYPGDDYVDIIGLDNYWDLGHPANEAPAEQQKQDFARSLQAIVEIANEKGKIAALTEGGQDKLPNPRFWTDTVLPAINTNATTRQLAYMMVWRNANREREGRDHFYVPYEGHEGAEDFLHFSRHALVLFENELPDMYVAPSL
ncbi:MAG TPA: glycosyl hydrolase [Cellvibrio sp.]|nr:glycosyl hydrolase [Cellvibrio sp.]